MKEDIQMVNVYMKIPDITNHQQNASQTTRKYHLIPVRIAIIRENNTPSIGNDVENQKPYTLLMGMSMVQLLWKTLGRCLNKLKTEFPCYPVT